MTGPHSIQQFDRVLKHVESETEAKRWLRHAGEVMDERPELQADDAFDGRLNFKRQWAEKQGEMK